MYTSLPQSFHTINNINGPKNDKIVNIKKYLPDLKKLFI